MANAIESALSRASTQKQARAQHVIEEARRNINLVSSQQMDDITPASADSIVKNPQIIEEANMTIPLLTGTGVIPISC